MTIRRLGLLASLAACLLLAGCALRALTGPAESGGSSITGDQWVVVSFDGSEEQFPLATMDALLATELAADEALALAGLGTIDGNEIGDHGYQLFFVGSDRNRMWEVLEPVFAEAPLPWTRVELFTSPDGDPDVVLTR